MRKFTAILFLLASLASCGGDGSGVDRLDMPLLYRTVPSDALALVYGPSVSELMAFCDSTSALHSLDPGELSKSRALLSVNYITSQIPALSIELGRHSGEYLARQADSLGLEHDTFRLVDGDGKSHDVAVVTVSAQLLQSIRRHIDENASIYDADCFEEVLVASGNEDRLITVRNSEIGRLLPKSFPGAYLSRSRVLDFGKKLSKWTVIGWGRDEMDMKFVTGISGGYFSTVLDSLQVSSCKVADVLPASTRFVIDLPIASFSAFRREYERFLDANVQIDRYRDTLDVLEDRCGRSPLQWEGNLDVKEVALVHTDSLAVLLLRPAGRPKAQELSPNPYRRFIKSLYGGCFDINDSFCASYGRWMVYGSEDDVRRFIGYEPGDIDFPSKCKALCYAGEWIVVAGENGSRIEINR